MGFDDYQEQNWCQNNSDGVAIISSRVLLHGLESVQCIE